MKKRYRALSGDTGVTHYRLGEGWIDVWFNGRAEPYRYRASRIGAQHLQEMTRCAEAGEGLSTYISRHEDVRTGYDE